MGTPRIEDVESPEIGSFYMVPTVYSERWEARIPIYGPQHEDAEFINFEEHHWHIDWRFVAQRFYRWKLSSCKNDDPAMLHGVITSVNQTALDDLRPIRLRMKREMPPYPPDKNVPWLAKLEEAFAKRVLPKCRTCPHRGISLRHAKPDANGTIICTGHGLGWNIDSGALVRRT